MPRAPTVDSLYQEYVKKYHAWANKSPDYQPYSMRSLENDPYLLERYGGKRESEWMHYCIARDMFLRAYHHGVLPSVN